MHSRTRNRSAYLAFLSIFLLFSSISLPGLAQEYRSYQVGDLVEVNHHGTWYRGQVSRVGPDKLIWAKFQEPTFGLMESFFQPGEVRLSTPEIKYRNWTSAGGLFRVKAKLESVNETTVKLKRQDNSKVVDVAIEELSQEDQEYLQPFLARRKTKKQKQEDSTAADSDNLILDHDEMLKRVQAAVTSTNPEEEMRRLADQISESIRSGNAMPPNSPNHSEQGISESDQTNSASENPYDRERAKKETRKQLADSRRSRDSSEQLTQPPKRTAKTQSRGQSAATRVSNRELDFSFVRPADFYSKPVANNAPPGSQQDSFNKQILFNYVDREASPEDPATLLKVIRLLRTYAKNDRSWLEGAEDNPNITTGEVDWDGMKIPFMKARIPIPDGGHGCMFSTNIPLPGEAIAVMVLGPSQREAETKTIFMEVVASVKKD